jgi:hypothetical protein
MRIVSRAEWGALPWGDGKPSDTPALIPPSVRRYFVVHYDGAQAVTRTGHAVPRAIDSAHRARGWVGIGYNFAVDRAGNVYEGRGWALRGAHCPGRNIDGIGVQVAIGGSQQPTVAALSTVRALYDDACRRACRALVATWHGAHYPTACPGPDLISWMRAGMPAPTAPTPTEGDDVALSDQDIGRLLDAAARHDGLLNAIADRLLSGRPAEDGGARYKVKDPGDDGEQKLIGLTEASTRQLALLRRLVGQ